MANEIRVGGFFSLRDSEGTDEFLDVAEKAISQTTKLHAKVKHNVGLTEEAMELGTLASLGMCFIVNRDATNFVTVRFASGGDDAVKVRPGAFALFEFGPDVTAPYLIADTAACQVEYLIGAP
ncbi:MAG TPA: hypothetical protein VM529_24930 [Gemmata sp.]|jgi:hypothetical protein|nr:hypothetical protein [Gemmata sp.]